LVAGIQLLLIWDRFNGRIGRWEAIGKSSGYSLKL